MRENLGKKLEETQDLGQRISVLKDKLSELELSLEDLSRQLHFNREEASSRLCGKMEQIISKMGMQNARFKIDLTLVDQFLINGKEKIDSN